MQEFAVGIFHHVPTKSGLKKALKKGYITVDGQAASTAGWIKGGERIELYIPNQTKTEKQLKLPLEVVYEDSHLAIIRKPPGILVSGNKFITVANALEQNLMPSVESDACKPQPVHRLDYATTGLLLVGKTMESIRRLNGLFEEKQIEKKYIAISIGFMESKGRIDKPIEDKEAISEYTVINTVASERFKQLNLVELSPITGRRHQLRIHMSATGNPILGDPDYGLDGLILKGKGMYLHAFHLKFIHPFTDERLELSDPLPRRFQKIFPAKP